MPNKSCAYLLNAEKSNLVFLKTYITEFGETIITFTDQNVRSLEIEDKVNLTLPIKKRNDILFYRTKNGKICQTKWIFYHLQETYLTNMDIFLDTAAKTGLDALKTASHKSVHKPAKAIGKFIESKIYNKTVRPIEEEGKGEEILNELRQVL